MAVYLATWDLNKEKTNYAQARSASIAAFGIFENIRHRSRFGAIRFPAAGPLIRVQHIFRGKMDSNDKLIVSTMVSGSHQGWLSKRSSGAMQSLVERELPFHDKRTWSYRFCRTR